MAELGGAVGKAKSTLFMDGPLKEGKLWGPPKEGMGAKAAQGTVRGQSGLAVGWERGGAAVSSWGV